ncbi:MAG: aromatic ring-hydroxylating dioxygenase subunit alpha [Mycobacterium sp.]|uniref:aromatic ring-hydroxylating oxygenase subunit alpha n=1 Tax=Mycobacterium sp. TaxID=1785 RepID=UPI003CC5DC89
MTANGETVAAASELTEPVTIGVEAYISEDYARGERDKLWRKVWQQVGRLEDLPEVGSYLTYDILDDSIVVVRTAPDTLKAHHNVCMHRGRRLVDVPSKAKNAYGRARKSFVCGFHGWTYDLDGACTHIPEQQDWQGALTADNTRLAGVNVDTWGGWIWVNMDPDCQPLRDYLEPAATMLDPFALTDMRCKWRKWLDFGCNWKVAVEAFNETYHVATTHPQFNKFGSFRGWAKAQGRHSNIGYDAPKDLERTKSKIRLGAGADPRLSTAEMQAYTLTETNATTTKTLVDAALRLADELPEGTPADQVLEHWLSSARRDDEARGVLWPRIDPDHLAKSGTAWQLFPNFQIGQGLTTALCYSARPNGYNPNSCIFEAACYELYPKGEEPETTWEYTPEGDPSWRTVFPQDFSNMAAVQRGMKSLGFPGTKPNPYMETSTANLHRNLATYMGTGAPRELRGE